MLVIMLLIGSLILLNSINLFAKQINDDASMEMDSWDVEVLRSEAKFDLKRLLRRFEKLLEYLESNYQQVNLDGLFGIRIAQSILQWPIYL